MKVWHNLNDIWILIKDKKMTTITEGQLTFEFDKSLSVLKYDESSYYQNQFQNKCHTGNKAVDIIVCDKKELWLIEIKDFRMDDRNPDKMPFANELSKKVRDSLAGIFGAKFYVHTDNNEKDLFNAMNACQKIYFVLHIEQPKQKMIYDIADIKQKLKNLLKAINPKIIIVNKDNTTQFGVPWSVR